MAAEKLREGQAALEVDAITALEIAQDCSAQASPPKTSIESVLAAPSFRVTVKQHPHTAIESPIAIRRETAIAYEMLITAALRRMFRVPGLQPRSSMIPVNNGLLFLAT